MFLMSDAPSESENCCRSIPGKIFNSFPGSGAKNVSTRGHLLILEEVIPIPISLYVTMNKFKEFKWAQTQDNIVLTQKNGLACTSR
jgi:hypothetical protein